MFVFSFIIVPSEHENYLWTFLSIRHHTRSIIPSVRVPDGGGGERWLVERRLFSAGQCDHFCSIGQECQISQAAAVLQASRAVPAVRRLSSAVLDPHCTDPTLRCDPRSSRLSLSGTSSVVRQERPLMKSVPARASSAAHDSAAEDCEHMWLGFKSMWAGRLPHHRLPFSVSLRG